MGTGYFDPDADERGTQRRPAKPKNVTELQKEALLATGHFSRRTGAVGYFSSQDQRKRFKALEEKALGADDESFLFRAWMRHNIDLCRVQNRVATLRPMGILLAMMENEDRRVDWTAANRKKVLANRPQLAVSTFKIKNAVGAK